MLFSSQVSEDNGISTLICADCNNKTIVITSQLETVKKTQAKIAGIIGMEPTKKTTLTNNSSSTDSEIKNHNLAQVLHELRANKMASSGQQKRKSTSTSSANNSEIHDHELAQVLQDLQANKMASSGQQKRKLTSKSSANNSEINDNELAQFLQDLQAKKMTSSAQQKGKLHLNDIKRKNNNSSAVENFDVGEKVKCYDIKLKQPVDAEVVKRVTYGQYAVTIGNRTVLRKAIFLSKK